MRICGEGFYADKEVVDTATSSPSSSLLAVGVLSINVPPSDGDEVELADPFSVGAVSGCDLPGTPVCVMEGGIKVAADE